MSRNVQDCGPITVFMAKSMFKKYVYLKKQAKQAELYKECENEVQATTTKARKKKKTVSDYKYTNVFLEFDEL